MSNVSRLCMLLCLQVSTACRGGKTCGGPETPQISAGSSSSRTVGVLPGEKPRTVFSLIPLISDPERYAGSATVVSGFLVLDTEHGFLGGAEGSLYLGREDATMLLNNRVNLRFRACRVASAAQALVSAGDVEELGNKYVTVRGTFESPPAPAATSAQIGSICGITSVTPIEDPRERRPPPRQTPSSR
jgi:hypothetical protein